MADSSARFSCWNNLMQRRAGFVQRESERLLPRTDLSIDPITRVVEYGNVVRLSLQDANRRYEEKNKRGEPKQV
jgi:hypothetical protein